MRGRGRSISEQRGRGLSSGGAAAPPSLLDQISTPTLAWGDIGPSSSIPWYTDDGVTPAVATNAVKRITEHVSGTQFMVQATAGNRAPLAAADGDIDRSYLTHDGSDFYATANNIGLTGDALLEIVVVARGEEGTHWAFGQDSPDGKAIALQCFGPSWRLNRNIAAGTRTYGNSSTSWRVIRVAKEAVATNPRLWTNGAERSGSGDSIATLDLADNTLKWGCLQHNALPFIGAIAAMLLYTTPINDVQRAADDAAIMTWFGL